MQPQYKHTKNAYPHYLCPVTFKVNSGTVLKLIKYAYVYVYLWVDVFLNIVFVVKFVMYRDNKYFDHSYHYLPAIILDAADAENPDSDAFKKALARATSEAKTELGVESSGGWRAQPHFLHYEIF